MKPVNKDACIIHTLIVMVLNSALSYKLTDLLVGPSVHNTQVLQDRADSKQILFTDLYQYLETTFS